MINFDEIVNRHNTGCVKWDALEAKYHNKDIIPMWIADMDFKVAPEISEALTKRATHPVYGYPYVNDVFKENFVKHFNTYNHHSVNKDQVILSTGVVFSINAIIEALTNKGDKIIIHSPSYPPFRRCVEQNDRIVIDSNMVIKNGRYELDFDDLESKVDDKTTMFILCNPQNPTGRVFDKEELEKLAAFCEKHHLLIISDEIHSDFIYDKSKFIPFVNINNYTLNHTVTCVSCTKSFNLAGLNVSAIFVKNKELFDRVEFKCKANGICAINIFGLEASNACYNHAEYWLQELIEYLKANMEYSYDFIKKNLPRVKVIKPESTYLLWLDLRDYNINNIQEDLVKNARVYLNDGKTYGEAFDGFVRFNFACPREMVIKALNHLKAYLG